MRRRSNLLVLLGLASFVLGLLAVYLITSDDDDDGDRDVGRANTVPVLVAAESLAAGELGDDILEQQRYRIEEVPLAERQADALQAPSQLSGSALTLAFTEGEQLRSSGLRNLGGARARIPEGFEAVSITVDFVAGGASTIIPGDRVNVFFFGSGTAPTAPPAEGEAAAAASGPRAELLLTNTEVLDVQLGSPTLQVSRPAEPGNTATTGGGSLIVVLAVNTLDAEKVIFSTQAEGAQLYLTRVRLDDEGNPAPPVEATPGVDFGTVLAEEAGDAFRRSNG